MQRFTPTKATTIFLFGGNRPGWLLFCWGGTGYSEGVGCEILIGISSLTFLESTKIDSFLEAFWRERSTIFLHKKSLLEFFFGTGDGSEIRRKPPLFGCE